MTDKNQSAPLRESYAKAERIGELISQLYSKTQYYLSAELAELPLGSNQSTRSTEPKSEFKNDVVCFEGLLDDLIDRLVKLNNRLDI
jgi:hypothetical protein